MRAGCAVSAAAGAAKRKSFATRLKTSGVVWALNPPLGSGAPRFLDSAATAAATRSYEEGLGNGLTDTRAADATAGYERAHDRLRSIEARATVFLQAAGLTGTLVLANAALIVGDDGLTGATGTAVTLGLLVAAIALVVAGIYALFAVTRTFSQVAPHSPARMLKRSRLSADAALKDSVASLLLGQRRLSVVGDWKLDRVKRASWALLVVVAGLAVSSGAVVAEALATR